MNESLAATLAVLPNKPGVYIMRDVHGKIIYVGKAIILKNRVRSYFRPTAQLLPKVRVLVSKVDSLETIVTANEMEALVLECNLIKQYRPRYNISLKDDKSYPYLKVTIQEEFPRVYVTRHLAKDGARYFGPYPDAGALHTVVQIIRAAFPLRTCRKMQTNRPCLQYHIKKCLAPCAGLISREDYGAMIEQVVAFLAGKTNYLEKDIKIRMEVASDNREFEEAAHYRDLLRALRKLGEEQKAVVGEGNQDVIGLMQDATGICIQVFFVRKGKLVGRDNFFLEQEDEQALPEVMTGFVKQYYNQATYVPKEILLNVPLVAEEQAVLLAWLSDKAKSKVDILLPQRGFKHDLLQMVEENAAKMLQERLRKGHLALASDEEAAEDLQKALGLIDPLERMDCFDISHTQGSETVASMVVFRNGSVSKKDYRHYKIKSAEGKPDDFKSMQEVVYRRYRDGENLPSLVVIDGGKGQLSSALEVIRGLGLHEVPIIGLAKREEEIFVEGQSESIMLDKESPALHLIQRLRDEAHRFAITYHRKLRGKRNLVSILDHIDGIGPKRRQALWRKFESLDAMKQATTEELAAVDGMNSAVAQKLYDFFRMEIGEKKKVLE